jgi:hypothetical protein
MADLFIDQLPTTTTVKRADLMVWETDPAGTQITKAMAALDFAKGWIEIPDTWTYASATTINVPTNATLLYQKGWGIRFKQGGAYKYGLLGTVAATLLTLIANADYSVANSAITDIAITVDPSQAFGFPEKFNFTSTVTYSGGTTSPTSVTVNSAYWSFVGGSPFVTIQATLVRGAGDRTFTIFSVPFTIPAFNVPISGTDNITAAGLKTPTACYGHTNSIYVFETMANDGTYEINGVLRLA